MKARTSRQISQIKKEVVVVVVVVVVVPVAVRPEGANVRTRKRLRGRLEPETGSLDRFRYGDSTDELESDKISLKKIGDFLFVTPA